MSEVAAAEQVRRKDLYAGLFWIIFGGAVAVHSTTMPIPAHLGATVLTGPGLVPALLGGCIFILGLVLVLRSLRGKVVLGPDDEVKPSEVSNRRAAAALGLMVLYASAFAMRLPFVPCTVLFVTIFVTLFNWEGRNLVSRAKVTAGSLVLALATGFVVEFVFESIFYVRLP